MINITKNIGKILARSQNNSVLNCKRVKGLNTILNLNNRFIQKQFSTLNTLERSMKNVGSYGIKSKIGGSSNDNNYEKYRGCYNEEIDKVNIPGVTIVRSKKDAIRVLNILKLYKDRPHAWDTETIDLDIKSESPVGKGKIICASCYIGMEVDFGNGPRLVIDNFGQNTDLILEFKSYFENEKYKKIWHNLGFDRHILYNHGIDVKGFAGDTMHMMRLVDASRGPGQYSLANITNDYADTIQAYKQEILDGFKAKFNWDKEMFFNDYDQNKDIYTDITQFKNYDKVLSNYHIKQFTGIKLGEKEHKRIERYQREYMKIKNTLQIFEEHHMNVNFKVSMKDLFQKKKSLKSGSAGKTFEFPSTLKMHTDEKYIKSWIEYSSLDAEILYFLFNVLQKELKGLTIVDKFEGMKNLNDLYNKYWRPFGELLTDMERQGFYIDKPHLEGALEKANKDIEKYQNQFLEWAKSTQPGLEMLNASSTNQLQQLFFAPYDRKNVRQKKKIVNTAENSDGLEEDSGYFSDGRKKPVRKIEDHFEQIKSFKVLNEKGIILDGRKKPLKHVDMQIKGLGWPIADYTATGLPSVDTAALRKMAGNPKKEQYGTVYEHYKVLSEKALNEFEKKQLLEQGVKASEALGAILDLRTVETLKSTFILSLIESVDDTGRIHCSININTETGRLSCKKPNLQNQPAMSKDIYQIRKAFIPEKGKKLIVADYGQVELRILAHMTNCKSMINAFKEGGDFHSRTAIGMYKEIQEDIKNGGVLLEWDKSQGEAPAPLVKDKYGDERKKAKTMNFSIAYGKTAHGFSVDWDCSLDEAQKALDLWYDDRKEVKTWQEKKRAEAKEKGWTQTLMGRVRNLTSLLNDKQTNGMKQHGYRQAINTPIQGGAADIVIACMVKVHQNERLRELGWKLQLQIHDEIVLEGPEESADEALQLVIELMENPVDEKMQVKLEVDAQLGDSWYECK